MKFITIMLKKIFFILFLFSPFAVFAQQASAINDIVTLIEDTFSAILPFLFIIATVVFLWGVIIYIAQSDDEGARKKAKQLMLWGIIGLAVITAVWGIVNVITVYFGIGDVGSGFVVPGPGDIPQQ